MPHLAFSTSTSASAPRRRAAALLFGLLLSLPGTALIASTPAVLAGAVAVLDTSARQVVARIAVPTGPHGVVLTPDDRQLYVSSDGASTVSVIDTATDQITSTIEVGKAPHGLAMAPDGRRLLVAVFGADQVAVIDPATNRVVGDIPVANPHDIAISPDGHTAYVASQRPDDASLAVIDLDGAAQVARVPLDKIPRALSVSPDGSRLWFTEAGSDAVQVLDTASNAVVDQIPVGASPHHPLFTPDGSSALVVSQGPGELALLNPATDASVATVAVGKMPHWIGLSGDARTAYVTDEGSNDVSIVDLVAGKVVATVPVGAAPRKIAVQRAAATAAAPAGDASVTIKGFAFAPGTVTISPGQAIVFNNDDAVAHTTTSKEGRWDSGELPPGGSYRLVLDEPGTYTFFCAIHPYMTGTVRRPRR